MEEERTRDIHSTYRYLAGYSPYPFKMDLSRVKFNVTPPTVLVSLVLLFRLVWLVFLTGLVDDNVVESLDT